MIDDKRLVECIKTHPTLSEHKKNMLNRSHPIYIRDVEPDTDIQHLCQRLDAPIDLATKYKNQLLVIDWNDRSAIGREKIYALITTVAAIMDWQWDNANRNRARLSGHDPKIFRVNVQPRPAPQREAEAHYGIIRLLPEFALVLMLIVMLLKGIEATPAAKPGFKP